MAIILTDHLLGPKELNVAVSATVLSATFGIDEISRATGEAVLEGPFQLTIDIVNKVPVPYFIGISLNDMNGVLTVADRRNVAYVGQSTVQLTISGASVPQLNAIYGLINSITIYAYGIASWGGGVSAATVTLRVSPAKYAVGAQPLIGYDLGAISNSEPLQYIPRDISYSISAAAHAPTVRASYTAPIGFWAIIEYIYVEIRENAATAVGTAFSYASVRGAPMLLQSVQNGVAVRNLFVPPHIVLSGGDTIQLVSYNGSANNLTFGGYAHIKEYK